MPLNKKPKILFLLPSFRGGGAEKVVLNIVNNLDREKFIVGLIVINGVGEYKYLLSQHVKCFDLKKRRAMYAILDLAGVIKKEKPDIVIASVIQSSIILYLSKFFVSFDFKIVHRLESLYSNILKEESFLSVWFFKKALENSDYIIALCDRMKNDLVEKIDIPAGKIKKIYNPIDLAHIKELSKETIEENYFNKGPVVLGCGRLEKVKGFSFLIKGFSLILFKYPEAKLLILGQGEEEKNLKGLVEKLNIKDRVEFLGFKRNPFKYMASADVFVLSSLWEGLPGTLLEAMICGVPVLVTDCPSCSKEILENGRCGFLVPKADEKALAEGILEILDNPKMAEIFSKRVKKRVEDFDVKKVLQEYRDLLGLILNK